MQKLIINFFCRAEKQSMRKVQIMLTDASKDMRHRQRLISIHITILGWLVEFFGFFIIILGSFILGHGSSMVTLSLQTGSLLFYFNLLPCILLINGSDFKEGIANNTYYIKVLKIFNCAKHNRIDVQEVNDDNRNNLNNNIDNDQ